VNLLLLEEADFVSADRVVLADRRFTHMQEIHAWRWATACASGASTA
jgi:hypothetical protein